MKFAITPVSLNDEIIYDEKIGIWLAGVEEFSLRCEPKLSFAQLAQMVENKKDKKVYVYVNALIEEHYLIKLGKLLANLNEIGIDGIIFQDFAVYQLTKNNNYKWDLIYDPDTLNTNYASLNQYHALGIKGAFLAREISLEEKLLINEKTELKTLVQVHGSEYMGYSKRKLVSNYLTVVGVDIPVDKSAGITIKANNQETLDYIYEDDYGTHIMTKNQLQTIDIIDKFEPFDYGIIDNQFVDDASYVKIVALYLRAAKGEPNLVEKLLEVDEEIDYFKSFTFDKTVYKIDDVRRIDDAKTNQ